VPVSNFILNLPGFSIKKITGFNPMIIEVNYRRKAQCPHCGNKHWRKKHSYVRQVRHELIGLRQTGLRFKAYKFYCRPCQRYFNQQFPGSDAANAPLKKSVSRSSNYILKVFLKKI